MVGIFHGEFCVLGFSHSEYFICFLQSNSKAMKINCSKASANLLKVQAPEIPLVSRGKIRIKGKEAMSAYWVNPGEDLESAEGADDLGNEKPECAPGSSSKLLEVVSLQELAKRAKKSGMTLRDIPNKFGARTLAELLSRVPPPMDDDEPDFADDFFLQSLLNPDDRAQIEEIRQDVARRLGVRVIIEKQTYQEHAHTIPFGNGE